MTTEVQLDAERADLLEALARHRFFLRVPARGLTDEQARLTPTTSVLSVGGLIKHVTRVEGNWAAFIVSGPDALTSGDDPDALRQHDESFRMLESESLPELIAAYDQVAANTDDLVRTLPDLSVSHPLPEAPWFEPGARWSARRAFLHIIAETAQHAGHADIIRESIDGAKSMG